MTDSDSTDYPIELAANISRRAVLLHADAAVLSWSKDVREAVVGDVDLLATVLVQLNGVDGAIVRAAIGLEQGDRRAMEVFEVVRGMRIQRRQDVYIRLACRGCSAALAVLLQDDRESKSMGDGAGAGGDWMGVGRAMSCCAQRGHVHTLEVFLQHMSAHRSKHEAHYAALVRSSMTEAARSGRVDVLRLMFDARFRASETVCPWRLVDLGCVLSHAASLSHADVVEWVADELDRTVASEPSEAFASLVTHLRLAVVDASAALLMPPPMVARLLERWSLFSCRVALAMIVSRQRLDVVQYVAEVMR